LYASGIGSESGRRFLARISREATEAPLSAAVVLERASKTLVIEVRP
jgi:hypothetical protein